MAKFALVGYGHDGRGVGKTGEGYTYVVNDNVRTKDIIQPIATSRRGRKFVTTGMVNHAYKETTAKGQQAKQSAQENGVEDLTRVYGGKELGVKGTKALKGQERSDYTNAIRAGNVAMQLKKDPHTELTPLAKQTYDDYAKQFMKKGAENE